MIRMDDGTEMAIRPGDVFDIPPGHDQWVTGDEPAVSIIWGGWRGFGKQPVGERILTTMLMTDITGSTDRAAAMGDAAWDQLLERHNGLVREVIEQYRGQEIDTTGDGFLIVFDGAARALQAAADIRAAVGSIGLEIHAGIHTGEVELVPGNIRGLAVHETARIMALAGAGEILVSGTTKELVSAPGVHVRGPRSPRAEGRPGRAADLRGHRGELSCRGFPGGGLTDKIRPAPTIPVTFLAPIPRGGNPTTLRII